MLYPGSFVKSTEVSPTYNNFLEKYNQISPKVISTFGENKH